MKKKGKYISIEQEELVKFKTNKTFTCISCGDIIDVESMKGIFNCPNCGWGKRNR